MTTQTPMTLYKLIVLYMLKKVAFPLTKTQISDFILGHEYTNFLTLQEVFADLIEADYVIEEVVRNRTFLNMTEEGRNTLSFFENRISDAIKEEISTYLDENKLEIREEISVQSRFYKNTSGEFDAQLIAKDNDTVLINLILSVPTEDMAQNVCDNWQQRNQEIYKYLTTQLF